MQETIDALTKIIKDEIRDLQSPGSHFSKAFNAMSKGKQAHNLAVRLSTSLGLKTNILQGDIVNNLNSILNQADQKGFYTKELRTLTPHIEEVIKQIGSNKNPLNIIKTARDYLQDKII